MVVVKHPLMADIERDGLTDASTLHLMESIGRGNQVFSRDGCNIRGQRREVLTMIEIGSFLIC